jgi:hypothetical protein
MAALAPPLDPDEVPRMERAARRLEEYAVPAERAEAEARRALLMHRDRRVHHVLLFQTSPELLRLLRAAVVEVEGLEGINVEPGRGLLVLSLHYGAYSSALLGMLMDAAASGAVPPVTVLIDTDLDPTMSMPEDRLGELEQKLSGTETRSFRLLDRDGSGATGTARRLLEILKGGETLVLFPDAEVLPPSNPRAVECNLGRRTVGFATGAPWLQEKTGCAVATVYVAPDGDHHRVVWRAADSVEEGMRRLVEETIVDDPAPWEGWLSDASF